MSSKLIELRKSALPALVEEILKLEAFKDITQYIVSITVTESQMTVNHLKDVSTMLAVVSEVREVDSKIHFRLNKLFLKLLVP